MMDTTTKTLYTNTWVILLTLLFSPLSQAQDKLSTDQAEQGEPRYFRTLGYFDRDSNKEELYFRVAEDQFERLAVAKLNFSKAYQVPATGIHLYKKNSNNEFIALPNAIRSRIPNSDNIVLLFMPRAQGQPNIQVIDFQQQKVPFGCYLIINTTKASLRGAIGGQAIRILPNRSTGSHVLVDGKKLANKKGLYRVDLQWKTNQSWRPLVRTNWRYDPESRGLSFVVVEPVTKRLRLMNFPIVKPQQKE